MVVWHEAPLGGGKVLVEISVVPLHDDSQTISDAELERLLDPQFPLDSELFFELGTDVVPD